MGKALRALGHGQRVVMIQFMKGRKEIGEYKAQKLLRNFKVYQFGRPQFIDFKHPDPLDVKYAREGLLFAETLLRRHPPDLLILDEINLAVAMKLLPEKAVLQFLKKVPNTTAVFLTGRRATKRLIAAADIATKVVDIKKRKTLEALPGLEY